MPALFLYSAVMNKYPEQSAKVMERYRTDPVFRYRMLENARRRYWEKREEIRAKAKQQATHRKYADRRYDERDGRAACYRVYRRALYHGELQRGTFCQLCWGTGRIQGHHPDHQFPLEVIWLCSRCHGVATRKVQAPS